MKLIPYISHKYSFNWIAKWDLHNHNVNSYFQRQGQHEQILEEELCTKVRSYK